MYSWMPTILIQISLYPFCIQRDYDMIIICVWKSGYAIQTNADANAIIVMAPYWSICFFTWSMSLFAFILLVKDYHVIENVFVWFSLERKCVVEEIYVVSGWRLLVEKFCLHDDGSWVHFLWFLIILLLLLNTTVVIIYNYVMQRIECNITCFL